MFSKIARDDNANEVSWTTQRNSRGELRRESSLIMAGKIVWRGAADPSSPNSGHYQKPIGANTWRMRVALVLAIRL
jgi:hypothetical protein